MLKLTISITMIDIYLK